MLRFDYIASATETNCSQSPEQRLIEWLHVQRRRVNVIPQFFEASKLLLSLFEHYHVTKPIKSHVHNKQRSRIRQSRKLPARHALPAGWVSVAIESLFIVPSFLTCREPKGPTEDTKVGRIEKAGSRKPEELPNSKDDGPKVPVRGVQSIVLTQSSSLNRPHSTKQNPHTFQVPVQLASISQ
jgi:hypothetical protein